MFAVVLVITAIVTFLWNIIGHGASAVDWETSFRFAILFGIILTWVKPREIKKNRVFKNMKQQKEGKNKKNHSIKTEYVFFWMAAPVTSGTITWESVARQHKKAQHLP